MDEKNDQAPSFPSNADQEVAAAQREQELEADRRARSERLGDGEVREGEVQAQRQKHNDRTGSGQVPAIDSSQE